MALGLSGAVAQTATVTPIPAPDAIAAAPAPAPAADTHDLLPAQTPIELQLETHLSTRDNKYGDGFAARVDKAVYFNGKEVIPTGSILEGHVVRVQDERPLNGDSELLLKPDLLTTPDGQHFTISAEVTQGDPVNTAKVDNEGTLVEPRGMMHSDLQHTEIGGGAGLVAGAALAGAKGAMIGGGVGAAVVAGIWLVRFRHLDLDPGSHLTVKLDRPLQLIPRHAASQGGTN